MTIPPIRAADTGCQPDTLSRQKGSCVASSNTVGDHADHCCTSTAQPGIESPASPEAGTVRIRYRIDKMDCPTEERLIRNRLEPMSGIDRL